MVCEDGQWGKQRTRRVRVVLVGYRMAVRGDVRGSSAVDGQTAVRDAGRGTMSNDHEAAGHGDTSIGSNSPTAGPGTLVHRRVADADGSVSMAVVDALAEARGVSPLEMKEPLYDAVDPDALDNLFESGSDTLKSGRVVFTTSGYEVTVTARDEVYVRNVE